MAELSLKMNEVMADVVLNVKFANLKRFKLRMKLAVLLIQMAAFILGCGVEFVDGEKDSPEE